MADPLSFDVKSRDSPWSVPKGLSEDVHEIAVEIVRIGRRYEWWGDRQDQWRRIWMSLNYVLGVPAAIVGALAGINATTSPETVRFLAYVSAGLVGLLTFLHAPERAARATHRAASCWDVSMKARELVVCDLPRATLEEAKRMFGKIQDLERYAVRTMSEG